MRCPQQCPDLGSLTMMLLTVNQRTPEGSSQPMEVTCTILHGKARPPRLSLDAREAPLQGGKSEHFHVQLSRHQDCLSELACAVGQEWTLASIAEALRGVVGEVAALSEPALGCK